ncbi:MAG: DmsE family decaheme c-type cytochrome [Bryobacterales bacterium]|nr:DmsE family decaheme c-type cytochrome [Bryobacteraceae bacterium]MDW8353563.1 DmsE family decaheme c-type cytochrome [Bryobacterales bacterium]
MRRAAPLFLLIAWAAAKSAHAAAANQYVGSEVCRKCHPDVWLNFYKNPHYKTIASGKEPPERTGCEGCHGPGQAHVEALGGKHNIGAFSEMTPQQALEACLACHRADLGKVHIERSAHTLAGIACSDCHSIHRSPTPKFLLAKVQREVCYGCHGNVRAQFAMPFKHRVNEGFMECSDCHNPHGAPAPLWRMGLRPRLVEAALTTEQPCLKCHSDKRGPFAFEHPAVRVDGCEACHQPHGSMNARLLRRPAVFTLCLECHTGLGAFGRQGDGIAVQSATHDMTNPRYQNCTTCHVRIHGSNADPRFLR